MNIANVVQGTPEWAAYRAKHFNASDAAAMLGCSPYKTRAQLLRELHTGVVPDVDTATHMRFQNGHRVEALARPLAEEFIGQELYPVVGSLGRLSASLDGLTLDESIAFEHKALNEELRACMLQQDGNGNDFLPLYHRVQMEQQQLVSGAQRTLFMASAWTAEGDLIEERHCWYTPDAALRQQIIDGWLQLEADLRSYVLPASAEPAPVGKAPDTLPALRIEVSGQVTASNLAEFRETALAAIRSVNRDLRTDQDFADAEKAVKWCAEVESRLKAAKEHALSQTSSIDELFKALDDIGGEARTVRLDLDKLVTRRKTEVKEEAVARTRRALDEHIAALNAELAPMRLPALPADFGGAIKGLRTVASIEDKLQSLLASSKIAADALARGIRTNVAAFQEQAAGYELLFADLGQLVHKQTDDFSAVLQARISTHKANEERKRQEAEAAEHRKMLASELLGIQQQVMIAQIGRSGVRKGGTIECIRDTLAETEAWPIDPAHWGDQSQIAQAAKQAAVESIRALLTQAEQPVAMTAAAPVPAPAAPAVQPLQVVAPAAPTVAQPREDESATLKLGALCERLGFTMTAAFVTDCLGVSPAKLDGASRLYRESDFQRICLLLQRHVEMARVASLREPARAAA